MFNIETVFVAIIAAPILTITVIHVLRFIFKTLYDVPWQTAAGMIEESSIQHDQDGDPYLELRYKFYIDGQPYWGNQRTRLYDRQAKNDNLRDFAIGKKIDVQFHPDDPENYSMIEVP